MTPFGKELALRLFPFVTSWVTWYRMVLGVKGRAFIRE